MRHLGQDVGGGGCDDDRIGGLRLGNVFDLAFIVEAGGGLAFFAPHGGDDLVAGERGERERLDEFLRGPGHGDADVDFILLQQADEFCGLVGGDSAGNADEHARCFSVHTTPSPPLVSNLQYPDCKGVALWEFLFCY